MIKMYTKGNILINNPKKNQFHQILTYKNHIDYGSIHQKIFNKWNINSRLPEDSLSMRLTSYPNQDLD